MNYIGRDFALVFVDPNGWSGFSLHKINQLIYGMRGEIIINFMFDFINRYFTEKGQKQTISNLLALEDWNTQLDDLISRGFSREEAILQIYMDQLRKI